MSWRFPVPATKNVPLRNTYSCKHPGCASSGYTYQRGKHGGIDVSGRTGNRVNAVHDGRIVRSGWNVWGPYYGRQVLLHWKTPKGADRYAFYAHLNMIAVKTGQRVAAGEKIGTVGASGNASGSHLHFELHTEPTYTGGLLNPFRKLEAARTTA